MDITVVFLLGFDLFITLILDFKFLPVFHIINSVLEQNWAADSRDLKKWTLAEAYESCWIGVCSHVSALPWFAWSLSWWHPMPCPTCLLRESLCPLPYSGVSIGRGVLDSSHQDGICWMTSVCLLVRGSRKCGLFPMYGFTRNSIYTLALDLMPVV